MRCAADDSAQLVAHMLPAVLHKLEGVAGARTGAARELQGLLCGTLQVGHVHNRTSEPRGSGPGLGLLGVECLAETAGAAVWCTFTVGSCVYRQEQRTLGPG